MKMCEIMTRTLTDLPLGGKGVVQAITAEGLSRSRLLDLGLVPGTEVTAVRRSPAGDPVAYLIRGTVIALRSDEGKKVQIN